MYSNPYNSIAVSASDNPPVLSGNLAHRGVALLWKRTLDDYISPLENISSDRIVGMQCSFLYKNLLFVLGVYLPSSKAKLEEFNSLGDKGNYEPNQRGLKLLDLADFFQSLSCKSFGIMLWSS